jgi:hypothetical protein
MDNLAFCFTWPRGAIMVSSITRFNHQVAGLLAMTFYCRAKIEGSMKFSIKVKLALLRSDQGGDLLPCDVIELS